MYVCMYVCMYIYIYIYIYIQGWGSLTMVFTGKFVYIAHHFILLSLNPFNLSVDWEEWWFEHSLS